MSYRTIDPTTARELLGSDEGWRYLDVRSEGEFAAGHPEGAYNVPVFFAGPAGMQPNAEFVEVVRRNFEPNAKLVVGCAAGGRSARACDALADAGFTQLANMHGGFSGGPEGELGWQALGFPCGSHASAERSYDGLRG